MFVPRHPAPLPMHLDLFLPGLLWPGEAMLPLTRGLDLSALSALLGRASLRFEAGTTPVNTLAGLSGLTDAPLAALRRLGEATAPAIEPAAWLCLDPVNLAFTREHLLLSTLPDAGPDALNDNEARALAEVVAELFADLGTLEICTPNRWYLALSGPDGTRFTPLDQVNRRPAGPFMPDGEQAVRWHARLNEAQVMLYNHPVNQAREATGRPAANSVWPWGAGVLPGQIPTPYSTLLADEPIARGLARAAGLSSSTLASGLPTSGGAALIVLDQLAAASQQLDLETWRSALQTLEHDWLAPILQAWRTGRIQRLRLIAPGDRRTLWLELARADRWKLWRRPIDPEAVLRVPLPAV